MSTGLTSAGAVQWVGGSWVAVVTPRGVMMLPPSADDEVVTDLWELLRAEGTSMVDLMDSLLSGSGGHIGSLPEFAAVLTEEPGGMHVLVRGRPMVFVDGSRLDCKGVETWYETRLDSPEDVRVVAPEDRQGRTRPVVDAIVSAAALILGGAKVDGDVIPREPEVPAEVEALVREEDTDTEASPTEAADEFLDAPVPAPVFQAEEDEPAEAAADLVEEVPEGVADGQETEPVAPAGQSEQDLSAQVSQEQAAGKAASAPSPEPVEAEASKRRSSGGKRSRGKAKASLVAPMASPSEPAQDEEATALPSGAPETEEIFGLDSDQLDKDQGTEAGAAESPGAAAAGAGQDEAAAPEAEPVKTEPVPLELVEDAEPVEAEVVEAEAETEVEAAQEIVEPEAERAALELVEDIEPETEPAEAEPVAVEVESGTEVEAAEELVEPEAERPALELVEDIEPETEPAEAEPEVEAEADEEPQDASDGAPVSSTVISNTVDHALPEALLAELDAEFGVDFDESGADDDYEDRYVLACPCPKGHPNPTSRSACRVCGEELALPAQRMVAPSLGTVTLSSGEVISLDRDLVVGRQPDVTSFMMEDMPPLAVIVPSPERLISRNHVHIMLDEWAVLVEDLATRNGTILCRDGEDPVRMAPGTSVLIRNGDELVLGDGQSLVFEDLP